jgi:hypothetical protein
MFDNLYDNVPLVIRVLIALVDYMVKASSEYRFTPQGEKEWNDFAVLYEQMVNNGSGGNVEYGIEDAPVSAQSAPKSSQRRAPRQSGVTPSVSQPLPHDAGFYSDPNQGKQ